MNTTTATVPDLGTRELVLSRILAAPRERVFRTWTTRLSEWWGPHGMTTAVREMDLRPGGAFRTVMRAPDGAELRTVLRYARERGEEGSDARARAFEDLCWSLLNSSEFLFQH